MQIKILFVNLPHKTDLKNVLNYVRLLSANIRNIFIERKINPKKNNDKIAESNSYPKAFHKGKD